MTATSSYLFFNNAERSFNFSNQISKSTPLTLMTFENCCYFHCTKETRSNITSLWKKSENRGKIILTSRIFYLWKLIHYGLYQTKTTELWLHNPLFFYINIFPFKGKADWLMEPRAQIVRTIKLSETVDKKPNRLIWKLKSQHTEKV